MKPGELYRTAIRWMSDLVSVYDGPDEFLEQFARVSEPQGLLWAAHFCQSEVCNGGFHQFFQNPTGVLAPEAIRGFQMIGVHEAARIISAATAQFSAPYPRDGDDRYQELLEIEGDGRDRASWDPFYELDQKFYRATGTSEFAVQADEYVRANMERFFK